jgi:heterodisulfide reductase subunit B
MKLTYFPGCSLKGTGRAYEESLIPVLRILGVELEELEDWNCCGATAYMAVDEMKACILAARNLALAEKCGADSLLAPCSACYLGLNKTQHYLREVPSIEQATRSALKAAGLTLRNEVRVIHPLDLIVNTLGLDAVKKCVRQPLDQLNVAPYYGCQIVRPYSTFDDAHDPTTMDRLIEALGATVVHYPLKTRCCGGSLTGVLPEAGLDCTRVLLEEALRRGANVISTVCPLCQFNLDGYHHQITAKWGPSEIPTVYFTQLMGLAFGLSPKELGLHRGFIPMQTTSAAPALAGGKESHGTG